MENSKTKNVKGKLSFPFENGIGHTFSDETITVIEKIQPILNGLTYKEAKDALSLLLNQIEYISIISIDAIDHKSHQ